MTLYVQLQCRKIVFSSQAHPNTCRSTHMHTYIHTCTCIHTETQTPTDQLLVKLISESLAVLLRNTSIFHGTK